MHSSEFQPLPRDRAETIALQALGWVAAQPDIAGTFLDSSGLAANELRDRAGDPEFLGFVLEYLLHDEAALIAFCTDTDLPADQPARARAALPGGALPHWT